MKRIINHNNDDYAHNEVFINDPQEVLIAIRLHIHEIIRDLHDRLHGKGKGIIPISRQNDAGISNIENYQNGLVITVDNTIPCNANKYDDFSQIKLFLMNNDDIHFAYSKLDMRLEDNIEYLDEIDNVIYNLYQLMGKKIELIKPDKKTKNSKKRKQLQEIIYDIDCAELINKFDYMMFFDVIDIDEIKETSKTMK